MPEDQVVEIDQENGHGLNQATFNVEIRSEQTSKLMDSFLHLHENTLIGVMLGVTMFVILALILYGFAKYWCRKLHQVCGEAEIMDNKMNNMNKVEQGKANKGLVFKGAA